MTFVSAANLQFNEDVEFTLGIIGIIVTAGLIIQVGGYLLKYNGWMALLASAAIFYLSFKNSLGGNTSRISIHFVM